MRGRDPRRRGLLARFGTLPGGLGVAIVAGSAFLGALITIAERRDPGAVLGVLVVLGTVVAGFAVRPRSVHTIIPAPTLFYVVAASVAGAINDRATDTSKIGLILHGGTWIASGFTAMSIATVLAIALTAIRYFLDYRSRPAKPRSARRSGRARRPTDSPDRNVTTRLPQGTAPTPTPGKGPQGSGPYPAAGQYRGSGAYPSGGQNPGSGAYPSAPSAPSAPSPGQYQGSGPYPGGGPRPGSGPYPGPGQLPGLLQLLDRRVAQHQMLYAGAVPEVDLGLGVVAEPVGGHHRPQAVFVVGDHLPGPQRRHRPVPR